MYKTDAHFRLGCSGKVRLGELCQNEKKDTCNPFLNYERSLCMKSLFEKLGVPYKLAEDSMYYPLRPSTKGPCLLFRKQGYDGEKRKSALKKSLDQALYILRSTSKEALLTHVGDTKHTSKA